MKYQTKQAKKLQAPKKNIEVDFVPWWHPTALLAGTMGNFKSLLPRAAVFHENVIDQLLPVDQNKMLEAIKPFERSNIDGLKIRIGASDPLYEMQKAWERSDGNALAAFSGWMQAIGSDLAKSDHYNPLSKTITLYANNPRILQHELGHALQPADDLVDKLIQGHVVEVEDDANKRAINAIKKYYADNPEKALAEAQNYRDIVYRGTGTYYAIPWALASALGGGLISAFNPKLYGGTLLSENNSKVSRLRFYLGMLAGGLLGTLGGSIYGRIKAWRENEEERKKFEERLAKIRKKHALNKNTAAQLDK